MSLRQIVLTGALVGMVYAPSLLAADDHPHDHVHRDEHGSDHAAPSEEHHGHDHESEHDGHASEPGHNQTTITEEGIRSAGVEVEISGPRTISDEARVYGRILLNQDRTAHITPRFPGVLSEVRKSLGDEVKRGEVLAIVESNQSLQKYEILSTVDGVVINRHATTGEFVSERDVILVISDLREVWADFQLYRDNLDRGSISIGQQIEVVIDEGKAPINARISYLSPLIDEATQAKLVRAVLPNPGGELRPGLFVSGILTLSSKTVPVAVRREAVQQFKGEQVVFGASGQSFTAMPVSLGRSDRAFVEVVSGLTAGQWYVAKGSFVIKADIEKREASHDH